jgi:hypothetical protein
MIELVVIKHMNIQLFILNYILDIYMEKLIPYLNEINVSRMIIVSVRIS